MKNQAPITNPTLISPGTKTGVTPTPTYQIGLLILDADLNANERRRIRLHETSHVAPDVVARIL